MALTSRTDGYFGNPKIHIPIPESMRSMARGLRKIGLKGQIDEFELAMNRSAESAAGEYFRRTSSEELRARFTPIVQRGMRQADLLQRVFGAHSAS